MKAAPEKPQTAKHWYAPRKDTGAPKRDRGGPKAWWELDPKDFRNHGAAKTIYVAVPWTPTRDRPERHYKKARVISATTGSVTVELEDGGRLVLNTFQELFWWNERMRKRGW